MEPITAIATTVIAVLSPYLKKGVEKFSEEMGASAAQKVKGFLGYLKQKFVNKPETMQTLETFAQDSDAHRDAFAEKLKQELRNDETLPQSMLDQLKTLELSVEVRQHIEDAQRAVGIKKVYIDSAGAVTQKKTVRVDQTTKNVEEATGIEDLKL